MTTKSKTTPAATNRRGNKAAKKPSNKQHTAKARTKTTAAQTAKARTVDESAVTDVKMSQIAAAERVLAESNEPMTCKAMVETMTTRKLWSSPGGKTPEATLYASILRDLKKGKAARFAKVDRGLFSLAVK